LIRHRTTEREQYIAEEWYGWDSPIYDQK